MTASFFTPTIVTEQRSRAGKDGGFRAGFKIRRQDGVIPEDELYEPFAHDGLHGFALSEHGLLSLGDPRGIALNVRKRRLLGFVPAARKADGELAAGLPPLRLRQPEITVIRQICPSVRSRPELEHLGFHQYFGDLPDDVLDTLLRAVEVGLFDQLQIWQEREFSSLSASQQRVLVVGIRNDATYLLAGWGGGTLEALSVAGLAREVLARCEIAVQYLVSKEVQEEKAPVWFEFFILFLMGAIPAGVLVFLGYMPVSFETLDDVAFSVSVVAFWCTAFGVGAGILIAWVTPAFWAKDTAIKLDPAWRWVRDTWNGRRKANRDAKAVARLMGTGNWRDVSRLAETARTVLTSCG